MKHLVAIIVLLGTLPSIGYGGTHLANVALYHFANTGAGPVAHREVMALTWNDFDIGQANISPPNLVMSKAILMRPIPGGYRPGGDLGNISGTKYGDLVQKSYRLALKYTEDIPLNGVLEVNRMVFGSATDVGEDYAALMTVSIMALLRGDNIPETSVLIGTLKGDGRIGPTPGIAKKVNLLKLIARKIIVPNGQLSELNPLQLQGIQIEEADTIDQAYRAMVQSR